MVNSNGKMWLSVCCGMGLSGLLSADVVTLTGDRMKLSGTVRSINEVGVVELASLLSPEPLMVKGDAVESVNFGDKPVLAKPPTAVVELVNGDNLPVFIESLDEKALTVMSPEAGHLVIPREHVKSMQVGVLDHKVIYAGPRSIEEWTSPEKTKKWNYGQNSFSTRTEAVASKKFNLPQQFVLCFSLRWEARQIPNYVIYFADPLGQTGMPTDRYFLQFGGAGLEIKRESTKGSHYKSLLLLNRTPNQYPNNQLKVEIWVDRKNSRLKLLLNGEPEGEVIDPSPGAPTGSGITLVCNRSGGGGNQEIRNIEILDNDNFLNRKGLESSSARKNDSLVSKEDDHWSGHLVDICPTSEGLMFHFKSDFQKEPLEISGSEVSSVWLATGSGGESDSKSAPHVIRLRGRGTLHVTSCSIGQDAASAVHPLLGPLKLNREGIVALEKTRAQTESTK